MSKKYKLSKLEIDLLRLRGQAIAKQLRETVHNLQNELGKRVYEMCLKGEIPTGDTILNNSDIIELKKCIFSSRSL